MSAKRIQLTIPTPCQQRWQDMRLEGSGRFCDSCQKTVVDFAAMTDQQIGAYFSNKSQPVCGRFTSGQLNRDVVLAQNAPNSAMKQRWLGLMTAGLLSWSATQGQSTHLPDKNVLISARRTPGSPTDRIEQRVTSMSEDSTWVITGQVIAENDKIALPGAYITVKGTDRGATTDVNGLFKLSLPRQDAPLILSAVYLGYVEKETAINPNPAQKLPLVISLAEDPAIRLTGEVVCIRKPSLFKKLRNRFKTGH